MAETRKIAAILAADVVGFSRLASADEDRTLARLRALRSDLIDPTIAVYNGRVFKRTGDGILVEFRSVVDAVRCAIEVQNAMVERNAGVGDDRRIAFRVGIHLGDVVEESDGDLMGDGVNIAARLEGVSAPGAICLSEDAYRQVHGRLDLAVTDLGPRQLKNIAEPVRAYSLQVGLPAVIKPPAPKRRFAVAPLAAIGVLALFAVAAGAWHFLDARRDASAAPERSIVVLPLTNLSGDAGQDYLVDALTDELTTAISRLPGTFVIARNTAFTYKGKASDVKAIGKDLGVRYALEGSVQPTASRLRVNAQLIDAESGAHLWAESFDEDRADLLQMEDDIVTRLARTLDLKMTDVEAVKAGRLRPANPTAEDLALRCLAAYNNNFDPLDPVAHPEIFRSCEQASRIDPGNTRALRLLASRLVRLSRSVGADVADDELKRLDELVSAAVAINPNDAEGRLAEAGLALVHDRYDDAIAGYERALALRPSNMDAYSGLVTGYFSAGQGEKMVEFADKAIRLSPHDPIVNLFLYQKAVALSVIGRDADALIPLDQAQALAPSQTPALRLKAAILANLGRNAEAREAWRQYVALAKGRLTTLAQYRPWLTHLTANVPNMVAWRERMFSNLRKAGMPEE